MKKKLKKRKKNFVIYKTTNLINGMFYIGKDSYNNVKYLGSGIYLNRAINKYGKENFKKEILEECTSTKKLNEREKYWIKKLNAQNKKIGYNIASGGDGQSIGWFDDHPNKERLRKEKSIVMKSIVTFKSRKENSERRKKYFENPFNRKRASKSVTEMWKNPIRKLKARTRFSGKNSSTWLGYCYVYNAQNKLVDKYDTVKEAARKLKMSYITVLVCCKEKRIVKGGIRKGYSFKLKYGN